MVVQQERFCSAFWEAMTNVGSFGGVTISGGWLMVIDGLIREMRKSFDETGHLFRMFLVFRSRRGVGSKFCPTGSKFCF